MNIRHPLTRLKSWLLFRYFLATNMGIDVPIHITSIAILANIMYVVVQERTREIGIKRSVGAKRKTIMGQFILEAFIIIGTGAVIGFLLAVFLVNIIPVLIPSMEEEVGFPELNIRVAIITMLILGIIGFLAGYFPARKASRLNVVDCLRH